MYFITLYKYIIIYLKLNNFNNQFFYFILSIYPDDLVFYQYYKNC